jgi:hypothetical protein
MKHSLALSCEQPKANRKIDPQGIESNSDTTPRSRAEQFILVTLKFIILLHISEIGS